MRGRRDNDRMVILHRRKFVHNKETRVGELPFTRIQIPNRLSYAITINKGQGQTLNRMGLALDMQEVFSHGQLYLAMPITWIV